MKRKIKQIAKQMQTITGQAVIAYKCEFEDIIESECTDKGRIEHTLDGMLGFCFDKNMLEMFRKLCRHYYGIDKNAATGYVYAYRDMWDSD